MKLTQSRTGLERTDNGMKQSSWPEPPMINQKNYYTYVPALKEEDLHVIQTYCLTIAFHSPLSLTFRQIMTLNFTATI
jgi:hypothetical protein